MKTQEMEVQRALWLCRSRSVVGFMCSGTQAAHLSNHGAQGVLFFVLGYYAGVCAERNIVSVCLAERPGGGGCRVQGEGRLRGTIGDELMPSLAVPGIPNSSPRALSIAARQRLFSYTLHGVARCQYLPRPPYQLQALRLGFMGFLSRWMYLASDLMPKNKLAV